MPLAPLKASASLWSADLVNLAAEIRRVDAYADLYHLDISDGTYARSLLLFFPDLVKAMRPVTQKPLEAHLITREPERWVDAFADAGANRIVFYPDTTPDVGAMIDAIAARGLGVGISLALETPVAAIEPFLDRLEMVCVLGTGFDVKQVNDVAETSYEKIRQLVKIRCERSLGFEIEADGAIRRHTVPRLRECGADVVVPGSLMFREDPAEVSRWLRSL